MSDAGGSGIEKALSRGLDLAIVDNVAFQPGSQAREQLCKPSVDEVVPIILLIPEHTLFDREWDQAIDDFIVEPYRKLELLSRIHKIVSQATGINARPTISQGALTIDEASYEVKVGKRKVDLTYREYQILRFLANQPGRVITREKLLTEVWGSDYFGGHRTIDVHIQRLRRKIEDDNYAFIETVRNVGYRFKKSEDLDTRHLQQTPDRYSVVFDAIPDPRQPAKLPL
ncbi:MAG: response regulator transcription factor [Chloroflexi bacterium]|nr:response regulator transcription factor [Chloroflexota bacterium]